MERRLSLREWMELVKAERGIRVVDPDGFNRADEDIWSRVYTESEFNAGLARCTVERIVRSPDVLFRLARDLYQSRPGSVLDVTMQEARGAFREFAQLQGSNLSDEEIDKALLQKEPAPRLALTRLRITDAPEEKKKMGLPFALGHDFADELCRIFNLDKSLTEHIAIEVEPRGLIRLTTSRYVTDQESQQMRAIMKDYALVPLEEAEHEYPVLGVVRDTSGPA